MKKSYMITCSTDPYHASRMAKHIPEDCLEYSGATCTKWIHDNNFGWGYTLDEARRQLYGYSVEDCERTGEKNFHKYFEMRYDSDILIYRIEEFKPQKKVLR